MLNDVTPVSNFTMLLAMYSELACISQNTRPKTRQVSLLEVIWSQNVRNIFRKVLEFCHFIWPLVYFL